MSPVLVEQDSFEILLARAQAQDGQQQGTLFSGAGTFFSGAAAALISGTSTLGQLFSYSPSREARKRRQIGICKHVHEYVAKQLNFLSQFQSILDQDNRNNQSEEHCLRNSLVSHLSTMVNLQADICKSLHNFVLRFALDILENRYNNDAESFDLVRAALYKAFLYRNEQANNQLDKIIELNEKIEEITETLVTVTDGQLLELIEILVQQSSQLTDERTMILNMGFPNQKMQQKLELPPPQQQGTRYFSPNTTKDLMGLRLLLLDEELLLTNARLELLNGLRKQIANIPKKEKATKDCMLHTAIAPPKYGLHHLLQSKQEVMNEIESQMAKSEALFPTIMVLNKLKVKKYFLIERNITQYKGM